MNSGSEQQDLAKSFERYTTISSNCNRDSLPRAWSVVRVEILPGIVARKSRLFPGLSTHQNSFAIHLAYFSENQPFHQGSGGVVGAFVDSAGFLDYFALAPERWL